MDRDYKKIAIQYAEDVCSGKIIACKDTISGCKRFLDDLKRGDLEMHTKEPNFVLGIIEKVMVHKQGEDLEGNSLVNKPLILQPWQVFCIYNLTAFYYKGTNERRYKEAFIFVPRKQGKTLMIAALAWGLALLERKSGAKLYITSASLKQASESYDDILHTLKFRGMLDDFRVRDNNAEHSLHCDLGPEGSIDIEAVAANPDVHDSFNCNIAIADEVHAFRKSAQYNRFKEAMKAYTNKLMIGITTAGDNINSFCYRRLEYAVKVLEGTVADDALFCFIARADTDENGDCDYTDPVQHQKANPSYGITIRPKDIMNDALQAQNDPQQRKDFLSRSLNVYTNSMRAYFDLEEFRRSDQGYLWTFEELSKLKIDWYGGADLSRMHDLTAAALFGNYNGVDIIISHAFFPVTAAVQKADEDNIPLFGWADDGLLTMCNSPTVNMGDIVNWFVDMKKAGFKIVQVGHDRKFAGEEFFPMMVKAGFKMIDQPQFYYLKSRGFRHIEKSAKDGKLYYLHSQAYEYCVSNVRAVEKVDDAVQYEKIGPEQRIDLFDASVFACIRYLAAKDRKMKAQSWWGDDGNNTKQKKK